ncbi:MAG: hypothetical protein PW788_09335 [Micavibrio sp.]|nr:hypothetical protein [Micavibrio sp.]
MLDDLPKDYKELDEWFRYFRFTKYLPAMPQKFAAEFPKAPDADAARTIMTAYAGAALDVIIFGGYTPLKEWSKDLSQTFQLKPSDLLQLSVADLAVLVRLDEDTLTGRLIEAGFSAKNSIITDFKAPVAEAPRQRPPAPGV